MYSIYLRLKELILSLETSIGKQLVHILRTLTLLPSISRTTGDLCYMVPALLASFKIPILPCSLGLWAFCFSFDNVF